MKKLLLFILVLVLGFIVYKKIIKNDIVEEKFIYEDILNSLEEEKVKIDYFTIYGKHLNFKGNLPKESGNYSLVFKNNEKEEMIKTNVKNNEFSTSNYINDGINLEELNNGEYIILLKNTDNNKYYSLINSTEYHDNKYYTITKNNKNNLITFNELTFNEIDYWTIKVKEEKLPDDVYDIVIDPGHGGVDTGAGNGKYHESKFTLEYAIALKEELEKEGLKVKLTREEDKKIDHYGVGSRTGIPIEAKAKLMLSIHLNSSGASNQRGVEIYKAYYDNNTYAKILADNIAREVGINYSNNPQSKIDNGVYMRVYSKETIASLAKDAKRDGYEPYVLGDDVTYYYFIRETGGIMTKAFSDGRNPKYQENPYRNYNQGVEAYLCELAYISSSEDLKLIINNKDDFIRGLKNSVLIYIDTEEKVQN